MGKRTDVDFLLEVLRDGQQHELTEIIGRSIDARGCGMTVHSRVADLRKRGWKIKNRVVHTEGRPLSYYQLFGLKEASDTGPTPSAGVSLSPSGAAVVEVSDEEVWEGLRMLDFAPPVSDAEGFAEEGAEQLGLLGGDPHAAPGAYSVEAA